MLAANPAFQSKIEKPKSKIITDSTTGGLFDAAWPPGVDFMTTVPVGSADIAFQSCSALTIDYRFTVEDPATFSGPFTVELPMARIEEPIFEYACHEGNYALEGILRGARAEEQDGRRR